jgi:predicted esterase
MQLFLASGLLFDENQRNVSPGSHGLMGKCRAATRKSARLLMSPRQYWFGFLVLVVMPIAVFAQATRNTTIIYKDGFILKGKINEGVREVIYDSASGRPFSIPSGNFAVDDYVRTLMFSPTNIQKVITFKPGEIKPPMQILRIKSVFANREIHKTWECTGFGKWNESGDREVYYKANKGAPLTMKQKMGLFTPHIIKAVTYDYGWELMYFTQEFPPEQVRKILLQVFNEKPDLKKLKDSDKLLQIAAFMQEAGWYKEAEEELGRVIRNFPEDRKLAEELLDKLKTERANLFVEEIDKLASVGQHATALERLDSYDRLNYAKFVTPKNKIIASDLKAKYAKASSDILEARRLLKLLAFQASNRKQWQNATEFIDAELHFDTIERLETFLLFGQQYEMDRKANRKLSQTAEQVLAIGISGWLQSNNAAEPDTKTALQLAGAREFLLDYLKTDNDLKRPDLLSEFKAKNELSIDVLTRMLTRIPPPFAPDADDIDTEMQTVEIDVPNGNGGSYLLQLPPDYHPLRSYPVLLLFHSGRDKADETMKRFSAEAAKHGYILAAPLWAAGNGLNPQAQLNAKEHHLVLDTLRDLRRKYQVDSDRVSLFGWEDGGSMAFDIGLGHPDQFANVSVMNGMMTPFAQRFYWPNAQYLPFYVIEGDRNGSRTEAMRNLFKHWVRSPYTCLYAEYRGRGSEWFSAEIPKIFDWMSRKKRHVPMKEIGSGDEEFRSSRSHDNRFYWLSSDNINIVNQFDHRNNNIGRFQPATFQASLSMGNQKDNKDGAKIWNQVNIRTTGVKQISFWITPGMMDLKLPLSVRVNGQQAGPMRKIEPSLPVLLEEVFQSGDRQRLFIAKVDVKM